MNRIWNIMIAAALACSNIFAQNDIKRSDDQWLALPDHPDWIYKVGEEASVEVTFMHYGIPQEGTLEYSIGEDRLQSDKEGSVQLRGGRAKINIGSRKSPGFRDLRLKFRKDGREFLHHVKVGFSPEKITPFTQEPKDFTSFWDSVLTDARKLPLSYTKTRAEEYCTDKIDCYLVRLELNKKGQCVYAYLFYPKGVEGNSARKCPAVLCPPGAGIKTIKEPLRHKYYAESGFIRLEMEIHGLNPTMTQEQFAEISKAFGSDPNGYLTNGLHDRNDYYMKRVYTAVVRCLDLLTSLPEWDGVNLAVQGGSQGGALSIVAAGLDPRVNLCVVNHPALSDMAAYSQKGRTGGYPHFAKNLFTKENIRTMAYYDVVNFARHVKAKTYMTWGFNDNVCPPTTSYAVWNTLQCEKEALITPVNEHWTSDITEKNQMLWLRKKIKGK